MSYYFKRGSKKVMAGTLMAIQNLAQQEADRLGRAVVIYGDEVERAVSKVYKRNPSKGYSVSYYLENERYWQFAGEFPTKAAADKRAAYIKGKSDLKVRVRKL